MKTNKFFKNRKTVKFNPDKGTFSIIPIALINNQNLHSDAKILMISILSDSDDFNLNPSIYIKKLGWKHKDTFYKNINRLQEAGYLRRFEIEEGIEGVKIKGSSKKIYNYLIDPNGKLNEVYSDAPVQPEKESKVVVSEKIITQPEPIKTVLTEKENLEAMLDANIKIARNENNEEINNSIKTVSMKTQELKKRYKELTKYAPVGSCLRIGEFNELTNYHFSKDPELTFKINVIVKGDNSEDELVRVVNELLQENKK
jgi:hypothetical protein